MRSTWSVFILGPHGKDIDDFEKVYGKYIAKTTDPGYSEFYNFYLKTIPLFTKIIFTGKIDEYFNYKFGELEYRGLEFKHEILEIDNFQGVAGMNYTSENVPFTRIVEHKHFEFGKQNHTIITKEYPKKATKNDIPYYPINDDVNNKRYNQYKKLAKNTNIIFGGRLAEYKYYDMHQVIGSALSKVKKEINKWKNV